jgi:hypothetical protein
MYGLKPAPFTDASAFKLTLCDYSRFTLVVVRPPNHGSQKSDTADERIPATGKGAEPKRGEEALSDILGRVPRIWL